MVNDSVCLWKMNLSIESLTFVQLNTKNQRRLHDELIFYKKQIVNKIENNCAH